MAEIIIGRAALARRMAAVSSPARGKQYMKLAGNITVGFMKRNIPHKTSNTSRSIHVEETSLTETSAKIVGSKVVEWIDEGTGVEGPLHHRITPKAAKALRWFGGPAGSLRLTGRPRKGKAGAGAGPIFARSTKGMKPRPFIQRSVREASQKLGVELKAEVINTWNAAG